MKSAGPAIAAIVIVLTSLPVLYVLGIGPAVWLHRKGILAREIEATYVPLEWAADYATFIRRSIEFCAQLWSPPMPPPTPLPNPNLAAPAAAIPPPAPAGS